jgi:hypothetical protein
MIERQPYLPRFMAGGEGNPLGARALYLGDTLYRIHGTNQPSTIGTFVSSGCIRLTNEDIMDLYKRVKVGTRVVVLPSGLPMTAAVPVGSRRGMSEVTPYGLPLASDMPRKRYKPEEISAKLQQVDCARAASGHAVAAPPSSVMTSRRPISSTGLLPRFGPAAPAMTIRRPTAHAVGLLHPQPTTEDGIESLGRT